MANNLSGHHSDTIECHASDDRWTVGARATIVSVNYGVEYGSGALGKHTKTVNHGLIGGDDYAFYLRSGDDRLITDRASHKLTEAPDERVTAAADASDRLPPPAWPAKSCK